MSKNISDRIVEQRVREADNTLGICLLLIAGFAILSFLIRLGDKPVAILAVESVVAAGVFGIMLWAIAGHWYRQAYEHEKEKEDHFEFHISGTAKGDTGRQSLNDLRNKLLNGATQQLGISISQSDYIKLQSELADLDSYRKILRIERESRKIKN